jgi:hypothetical protein
VRPRSFADRRLVTFAPIYLGFVIMRWTINRVHFRPPSPGMPSSLSMSAIAAVDNRSMAYSRNISLTISISLSQRPAQRISGARVCSFHLRYSQDYCWTAGRPTRNPFSICGTYWNLRHDLFCPRGLRLRVDLIKRAEG